MSDKKRTRKYSIKRPTSRNYELRCYVLRIDDVLNG